MIGVARAFAEPLEQRKKAGVGIEVTLQVFPAESHISVVPWGDDARIGGGGDVAVETASRPEHTK
jgi:hypothetical protein